MKLILILSKVLLITCLMSSILVAQGFLRVSGTKIVKGDGDEVILRGIGLGGWLVPEGYMLHTAEFANSPTEIRNKIMTLVGQTNADQFFQLYRQNYVTRRDIDSIANWGFNSVRLPMHYDLLTPKDSIGVYSESGFEIIDSLLSWCEANQLYLILDLHCAPGGQNNGNISDYQEGYPSLWEDEQYQQRTVDLWKIIAARYVNKQWIGGYDLLNETAWDLGTGNIPLHDLMVKITDSIRTVDTNHIVFIEGNSYATDFSGLDQPWDANLVYSFHKYWNSNDPGSISGYLNLRSNTNRPLWCGESGENSNQWFADCIALFEINNIGWSWWPLKKIESTSTLLSSPLTAEYNNLLRYWNGQVSQQPTIQEAVNALNNQAIYLNIDRCFICRDVIDAMFRQPQTSTTLPFVNLKIPGNIYAVNYDMGKNGFAYKDNDYQNTYGPSGGSWNSGGLFRNDGVDIERCSDFPTNGYDVGWTGTDEFLSFTIDVTETATYELGVRYTANTTGGMIRIQFDGSFETDFITIPSTGGWQSWQILDAGQFTLTSGTHTFAVHFFIGGFNINYFKFTKVATQVSSEKQIIREFLLLQNYPNPINPTTTIEFSVPPAAERDLAEGGKIPPSTFSQKGEQGGFVSLKVFDLLGREVAVLVNELKPAGKYEVKWNANSQPSGIYIICLESGGRKIMKKMLVIK